MYIFLTKRNTTKKLREKAEHIIKQAQISVKEYFTFSFSLIGSGSNLMITYDESNHIDLDYNLIIQKDKKDLLRNPKEIRTIFSNAFKKACGNDVTIDNKKNVFTCCFKKTIDGFKTSLDVAVMVEIDDGYLYKIYYDHNNDSYIWNKVKGSKDVQQKIYQLRHSGRWGSVRKEYLDLKNDKRYKNEDSYLILLNAINNVITRPTNKK